MRRVLLTGASGFVGAAVLRRMVAQEREVAVLLRASSDTRRIDDLLPHVAVVRGDLAHLDAVTDAIAAFGPDVVAHLAWQGVKGSDRNDPGQLENVMAAITLQRVATAVGCTRMVGLGSQAEYGPQAGRIAEDAPTRPTTMYGAAKLATAILLERACATAGQSFAWMRLFSSYGPGDDPSWMIPYLIERLLAGERPSLTAAEQVWDYIHVEDAAAAVVAMVDADATGVFNLGSGTAWPLRDIITTVRDAIDPSLPLGFGEVPYRPDQVMHLEADVTRLRAATGWAPAIALREGLQAVVDHHRARRARPTS
ncbi:CDP-abequose synthase [Luteitalea sp. TBR-22]|uniref:NAD-dependent epimerase/dehydratase family protein n=1 Tax=Luteitalea sp. TBR-22 TaxID=2802971 RepID=UPI001AF3435D|nr:NAD(P)-dependent oxidoreductase [Luteitalea sp. TBR-22]BCS34698.1 CDP-abequose synthase [Luteitalea sp. TBR-22]